MVNLASDERLEPLGNKMHIVVSDSHTFGTDAILLSNFASIKRKDIACDMGTGCGIIPLVWCKSETNRIFDARFFFSFILKISSKSLEIRHGVAKNTNPSSSKTVKTPNTMRAIPCDTSDAVSVNEMSEASTMAGIPICGSFLASPRERTKTVTVTADTAKVRSAAYTACCAVSA